jgi:hypothetical protein
MDKPDSLVMSNNVWDKIKENIDNSFVEMKPWCGLRVIANEYMPDNKIAVFDCHGNLLQIINLA